MSEIRIGPGDDGRDIQAAVGDILVLRLPENPTTGLRWGWGSLPGPIRLSNDTYEDVDMDAVGAASVRVLTFDLNGPGTAQLSLKRMQAWEGDASADACFSCRVRIMSPDSH